MIKIMKVYNNNKVKIVIWMNILEIKNNKNIKEYKWR